MVSQVMEANRRPPLHMFYLRGLFGSAKDFYFTVVMLSVIFILVTCKQFSVKEHAQEFEAHSSYLGDFANSPDVFDGHFVSKLVSRDSVQQNYLDNICLPSNSLFLPATLSGLGYNEIYAESEVSDYPVVQSEGFPSEVKQMSHLSRRIVSSSLFWQDGLPDFSSCASPLFDEKTQMLKSVANSNTDEHTFLNDSYTPPVEIKPSLLDYGHKRIDSPSLAFFTLNDVGADSVLNVVEPCSSNSQFYACNSTDVLLAPGEVASICFIFSPSHFGLSSGQLALQTRFGVFLIQAKGFAVESPYSIKLSSNFSISSSGRWRRNLSLFNPFIEALYLEELTAWISTSSRSILLKPFIWKSCADLGTHEVNMESKILMLGNNRRSGQMEISCTDVINVCSECELDSSVGYTERINEVDYVNGRQIFFGNSIPPPSGIKLLMNGFATHNCSGICLQSGESSMLLTAYQFPSTPMCVLNFCKRSMLWMWVKKAFTAFLFAIFFLGLLVFLLLPHITATAPQAVKNTKNPSSFTYALNYLYTSFNRRNTGGINLPSGDGKQTNSELGTAPETNMPSFEHLDVQETLVSRNMKLTIGKEKGKRRRKKKSSRLHVDASTSQSGHSLRMEQTVEIRSPFSEAPIQQSDTSQCTPPSSKVNFLNDDVYLGDSSLLASTHRIAAHARAPGANLKNPKNEGLGKNMNDQQEYTYDIWGDHLFGLSLAFKSKEESSKPSSSAIDNSFESFFVRGPLTLMKNSVIPDVEGNE